MQERLYSSNPPYPHGDAAFLTVVHALQGVAAKLPAETRVFCGHEYTVSNLQFAKSVEPESVSVADKLDWSKKILASGGYTVPSTVRLNNPVHHVTFWIFYCRRNLPTKSQRYTKSCIGVCGPKWSLAGSSVAGNILYIN